MALTVKKINDPVKVVTSTFASGRYQIPGITTGAAYADGDVIGRQFSIKVPKSGVIQSAVFYDLDDEGIQIDFILHRSQWTTVIADNDPMDLADDDLVKIIDVLEFSTFVDFTNGRISFLNSIGKAYVVGDDNLLWVTARARGIVTIAAGNLPQFQLTILSDS